MFYLERTKRWVLDRTHPSNKERATQANAAAAPAAAASTNATAGTQINKSILDAWMANAQKDYEQSLRDFVAQYS